MTIDDEIEEEKRRTYGIVGSPVSHSLSPIMHNAAFTSQGLNAEYLTFEVPKNKLGPEVKKLREMEISGFNVTVPHKESIIQYLDGLDELADRIGAVNTVVNEEGNLVGYNTDGPGAVASLEQSGVDLDKGGTVLILGAGGSARAIGLCMAEIGFDIKIVNRTHERAVKLAGELSETSYVEPIKIDQVKGSLKDISIIVNCTSLGMKGNKGGYPITLDLIEERMAVFDIVYTPIHTPLLQAAMDKGARVIYGYKLLVNQGIRSYELWTARGAPDKIMIRSVLEALKGD